MSELKYSNEDFDALNHDINKLFAKLEHVSLATFETKIEIVKNIVEKRRLQFINGKLPFNNKHEFCDRIKKEIAQYDSYFNHPNDKFYDLFTSEEKKRQISVQNALNISSLPPEKQTGSNIFDELEIALSRESELPKDYQYKLYLDLVKESSEETTKHALSLLGKLKHAFHFIHIFDELYPDMSKVKEVIEKTNGKQQKMLSKYYGHYLDCKNVILSIESGIGSTDDKMDSIKEMLGLQNYNSKNLDERSKITFIEKWNIIVAEIEIGVSAIAKKLGINKKHCTNNIRPTHNPVTKTPNRHHEYINWFRAIQVKSPSGEEFIFDAKEYFDKQIERAKLNISFQPLVLRNCEVSD